MSARRRRQPFPLPHTVTVQRRTEGADDGLGNSVPAWPDPEQWAVAGLYPISSAEQPEARVEVDRQLMAPSEIGLRYGDRVTFRGAEYEVSGLPEEAGDGPWWDLPMCTVPLKEVKVR